VHVHVSTKRMVLVLEIGHSVFPSVGDQNFQKVMNAFSWNLGLVYFDTGNILHFEGDTQNLGFHSPFWLCCHKQSQKGWKLCDQYLYGFVRLINMSWNKNIMVIFKLTWRPEMSENLNFFLNTSNFIVAEFSV